MRGLAGSMLVAIGLVSVQLGCGDQSVVVARQLPPDNEQGGSGGAASTNLGAGGAGGSAGPERPMFSAPTLVVELSDPEAKDQDPTLTEDLLEIFFFSDRGDDADIWTSRRANRSATWDEPELVSELANPDFDENPAVSRDGLRLWFFSHRDPLGIWYTTRSTRDEPWNDPVPVSEFADQGAIAPTLDASELRMAVSLRIGTSRDIYETVRASRSDPWTELVAIAGLNGDADDSTPFFIDDGKSLLFSSGRAGGGDLFWAVRDSFDSPVRSVDALAELNDPDAFESHPYLSVDRTTAFFGSDRTGGTDIYTASVSSP